MRKDSDRIEDNRPLVLLCFVLFRTKNGSRCSCYGALAHDFSVYDDDKSHLKKYASVTRGLDSVDGLRGGVSDIYAIILLAAGLAKQKLGGFFPRRWVGPEKEEKTQDGT